VTVPSDYDDNPARWQVNRAVRRRYGSGDVHTGVAERFASEGLAPVLDVGCGEGDLARLLPDRWPWIGLDASPAQLTAAPRPVVQGHAGRLPFADASVGAVAFLWMLYHVPDPAAALADARRVLRPGGLVAASTTSRADSPELAEWINRKPTPFDAEEAPDLFARFFEDVEVGRWDAPLYHLPDADAVRSYLLGRLVPASRAEKAAATIAVPLDVTKRGVLVFGRKSP
jgi:SAM-dependent methyltransferase